MPFGGDVRGVVYGTSLGRDKGATGYQPGKSQPLCVDVEAVLEMAGSRFPRVGVCGGATRGGSPVVYSVGFWWELNGRARGQGGKGRGNISGLGKLACWPLVVSAVT